MVSWTKYNFFALFLGQVLSVYLTNKTLLFHGVTLIPDKKTTKNQYSIKMIYRYTDKFFGVF